MSTDWAKFYKEKSKKPINNADFGGEFGGIVDFISVPALVSFRRIWDPYVMGVIREEKRCSDKATDPATKTALLGYQSILNKWNQFAGLTQEQIALRATGILADYSDTVNIVKKEADLLLKFCPDATIPPLPSDSILNAYGRSLGGQAEGLKIATGGAGQLADEGIKGGTDYAKKAIFAIAAIAGVAVVVMMIPEIATLGLTLKSLKK